MSRPQNYSLSSTTSPIGTPNTARRRKGASTVGIGLTDMNMAVMGITLAASNQVMIKFNFIENLSISNAGKFCLLLDLTFVMNLDFFVTAFQGPYG